MLSSVITVPAGMLISVAIVLTGPASAQGEGMGRVSATAARGAAGRGRKISIALTVEPGLVLRHQPRALGELVRRHGRLPLLLAAPRHCPGLECAAAHLTLHGGLCRELLMPLRS
jgi:hypothetical protein